MKEGNLGIYKIPQIKTVKAMPEYNLLAVDFYPFMDDLALDEFLDKVDRGLDLKSDINKFVEEYTRLKNSVLIPDGDGCLYRWFFKSTEDLKKFLKDKQNE